LIDTPKKRSSVFELPGLMMNPFPSGIILQGDRQQISDVYAGILSTVPGFLKSGTHWVDEKTRTNVWSKEKESVNIWVKEIEETGIWTDEKELIPY
jgi:hypothetical protein